MTSVSSCDILFCFFWSQTGLDINFSPILLRIMLRQWEETQAVASQLLESGDHMLLVDFDSHLDDITKDWTNQKLNTKIAELASPANGNI